MRNSFLTFKCVICNLSKVRDYAYFLSLDFVAISLLAPIFGSFCLSGLEY